MGMPGPAVRAGKFDQPGTNAMDGMKGMDHGDMAPNAGTTSRSEMASAPVMGHAGHEMSGMAHEQVPMDTGMVSRGTSAAPKSSWLVLLASRGYKRPTACRMEGADQSLDCETSKPPPLVAGGCRLMKTLL
jgi:hypothetical protein